MAESPFRQCSESCKIRLRLTVALVRGSSYTQLGMRGIGALQNAESGEIFTQESCLRTVHALRGIICMRLLEHYTVYTDHLLQ
jgi:hypothetical protein